MFWIDLTGESRILDSPRISLYRALPLSVGTGVSRNVAVSAAEERDDDDDDVVDLGVLVGDLGEAYRLGRYLCRLSLL